MGAMDSALSRVASPGFVLGTSGAPPTSTVPAGAAPLLGFTAMPAYPNNVVAVAYRVDGGPMRVLRTTAEEIPGDTQAFVARLPALNPGQRVDYRGELSRAGRSVAVAPADGSWQTIVADAGLPATPPFVTLPPATMAPAAALLRTAPSPAVASRPAAPSLNAPSAAAASAPRFAHGLDFLGALTVQTRAEVVGHTPQGFRINFYVVRGEIRGPGGAHALRGMVRPGGVDTVCIRPDGVGELDAYLTYEMDDGSVLMEEGVGQVNLGPEGYAAIVGGLYVGTPPLFAAQRFVTAEPRWQWINLVQCFGFGRVVMHDLRVECDIYAPHIETGPGDA
jgi:hypothetical protein